MNIELEKEAFNKKTFFMGLGCILVYIIVSIAFAFVDANNKFLDCLLLIISYIIIGISSIMFFKERLKRDFSKLKENKREYIKFIIKNYFIMLAIYYVVSIISFLLLKSDETSINQQTIESLPVVIMIISAAFYAPLTEELVFRGSIHRLISNKFVFVIVSGLVFGLLHTISEPTIREVFLRGLPYITIGTYFSYIYAKTENICVPILFHFLHNSIALIVIFLSTFF